MSALQLPPLRRVATFSRGVARIPHLRALLGAREVLLRPSRRDGIDAVVGWGRKRNAERARRFAAWHGLPFLGLEDGFLRSYGLAAAGVPPLSIVVDGLGIHYDATRPSAIERALA